MKKALIAKIVVYGLAVVFLTGVLIFGLSTGFGFKDLREKGESAGSGNSPYDYRATTDVTEIEIGWVAGDIVIRPTDGKEIVISESAGRKLKEHEKLSLENEDERLRIQWNDRSFFAGFSLFNSQSKDLLIEIPKTVKLEQLTVSGTSASIDIENQTVVRLELQTASGAIRGSGLVAESFAATSVSGDVELESLLCKSARLFSTSGKLEAENLTADKLETDSVSGKTQVGGSALEIHGNSVSGGIEITTALAPTKAFLGSVTGKVLLTLPENPGFLLEKSSISGRFGSKTFSLEAFADKTYYKDKNAESVVKLSTTSGQMALEKGEGAKEVETYEMWQEKQKEAARKAAEEAEKKKTEKADKKTEEAE